MKKLICGILMLGTIAGVYGQKVMSLEECRLLALENNKMIIRMMSVYKFST